MKLNHYITEDRKIVSKWKRKTEELIRLLKQRREEIPHGQWEKYLEGIGLNRVTVYRWLKELEPKQLVQSVDESSNVTNATFQPAAINNDRCVCGNDVWVVTKDKLGNIECQCSDCKRPKRNWKRYTERVSYDVPINICPQCNTVTSKDGKRRWNSIEDYKRSMIPLDKDYAPLQSYRYAYEQGLIDEPNAIQSADNQIKHMNKKELEYYKSNLREDTPKNGNKHQQPFKGTATNQASLRDFITQADCDE